MKTITYMLNPETGIVYSRVGSEVAIPVLEYDKMTPKNGFATSYALEKFNVFEMCKDLNTMIGIRKIPVAIKNRHRKFWGMKEI